MSPLTIYLGKFLGLSCLVMCVLLAARPRTAEAAIAALAEDPALTLITGIITLAAGMAMVLAHDRWSGGALPVLVTLFGWIALLKGILLLAAPPSGLARLYRGVYGVHRFRLVMAAGALLSAWLSLLAFSA